ncbi:hypothetical protein BV898_01091 [Hypsibius exemplaris]|uniref:Uncharacterized protein n=1 Tax=Hypsibius exemplaris TaxID=2072580 RepID=A0A1W0XD58_HYPEX|nr:hypothetical protein BV898_01091 [Hypsibius exemplaris]
MKATLILLLIGVATVASQRNTGTNNRRPSGGDRDDSRDRDNNDDRRGSGSNGARDRTRFPDFARVEVEIQRLENSAGILSNGKSCDFTGACDPVVNAFLDADSPLSPWPGNSLALSKWPLIFQVDNVNSPSIGKSVNRDICGGALNKVNLRVHVSDSDSASSNDEIGNFECVFDLDPRDITADALSAQWGPSTECKSSTQPGKIRLFARERAYQIASSSCRASGAAGSTDGRLNSELGADAGAHVPGQHDYIRIDTEVIQLLNPQGLLATKKSCDSLSKCDPRVSVFLDTDKPLAAWPGAKTVPEYTVLFEVSNTDSPIINKNVSKNICGGSVGKVNLRVDVVDVNVGSNALIEDFECLFTADYRLVARDLSSAEWSPAQDCKPQHANNDIRLQYRYRIYDIPQAQCGIGLPAKKMG